MYMSQKDDIIEEYGIDFVARFACLYEGVNVASDRAEKLGYTGDTNVWIKPTALQKYIEEQKKIYQQIAMEPNHFNIFR